MKIFLNVSLILLLALSSAAQNTPTNIRSGVAVGANVVRFDGNNSQKVTYEIWRQHGDTVTWYLYTTTKDDVFVDTAVNPGQIYEYCIRARIGNEVSDFSESTVIYNW